ncbi:hypothetical protein PSTG_14460 [Puccinia striiformis f. sp. tritici PST-78]|uniref:Uncharacterized protein n=1 Tax=Puccinia striiformis f. sp. tritici PST-78 TaxID=1165861 RepID=A0A0L0UYJ4_9BASI|nr:hypothetical protein PSTG_14460 [Puccinia striiformis f. sp. tritici PST-78]
MHQLPVQPANQWKNSNYGFVNKDPIEYVPHRMGYRWIDSREALSDELLSEVFPLLASQLATLSLLLNQESIRQHPGSNLMRLSELQPALDYSMTRVGDSMAHISPLPLNTSERVDDQQLKQFKSYRLNKLASKSTDLQYHIYIAFASASAHLAALNLCRGSRTRDRRFLDVYMSLIRGASVDIDSMIQLLSGSELVAAKGYWERGMRGMTEQFSKAVVSLGSSADHLELQQEFQGRQFVRQPVIHLTQSFIPVIKLSRLFFNKLTGPGLNTRRLPAYTEMNSKQLKRWFESAQKSNGYLFEIWSLLLAAAGAPEGNPVNTQEILETAESLISHFEAQMLLVLLYIVPLIPETDPDHNYYKNWFATWNIQFILAINHFQHLARSLGRIP